MMVHPIDLLPHHFLMDLEVRVMTTLPPRAARVVVHLPPVAATRPGYRVVYRHKIIYEKKSLPRLD